MSRRRIVALATLVPLLLAACGGDDGTGTPAGPAHDIVFAGEVAGTTLLMRTRGAERTVRRIGLGYPGTGAAPNADGTRLVFTSLGSSAEPPRLLLLDSPDAEPRPFGGTPESYEREADWAPGNQLIAFTSLRDDTYGDVFAATVGGDMLVQVTNLTGSNGGAGTPDMTPAWSPNGTRIAFTSYRGGNPSVWIMNADGTQPVRLTTPGDAGDYFPTWSPAGDSIAFQRLGASSSRIGLVAVSGGDPRFLTLPGDAFSPAWAPDAAQLAVAIRDAQGDIDIHVVGTDGSIKERVRREGRDYLPAWIRREARF